MNKFVVAGITAIATGVAAIGVVTLTGDPAAWQGSFDASYAAAAPGTTIEVPAGNIAQNYPAEGAVKIRASSKSTADPITFVCKGDGDVIFPEGQLVITARNVVIRGACFKMKKLWIGDPANGISTSNVTIDGVSMQTFDISGSDDVTLKNSDVGPSVASAANPRYAEPKIHSGGPGGGVSGARILLDNLTIHDMQTLDSVAYHTGGLWVGYGSAGSLTIRNSRFMRNAIYDIHVDRPFGGPTPNLTLEGNTFQYPVEPLDNTRSGLETTPGFTELQVKCVVNQPITNWTIINNSWQHGWDLKFGGCSGTTYSDLTITGNTGGMTRNPAETGTTPPSPSTTPVDNFERATLGSNWNVNIGSPGIVAGSDLGLLSGFIAILSWASPLPSDQFSEAEVANGIDPLMQRQVFVRRRAADSARYALHYNLRSGEEGWEIKYDGVPTAQTKLLARASTPTRPVAGDVIRIEVQGSTIRGYKNGQLIIQAVDTSAERITSGAPGMSFVQIGTTSVTQPSQVFERWAGGEIVVTPPPPPPVTDTTPVPPACIAPTLGWKLPTRSTITLTWPSVPSATSYKLFKNGVIVATSGTTATSAKFGSLPYGDTLLGVSAVCPDGEKLSSLTTFETRGVR